MRDDPPGSEGRVNPPDHPEHAEPGQMFSSLVHLEELREVRVDDGHRAADAGTREKELFETSQIKKRILRVFHPPPMLV